MMSGNNNDEMQQQQKGLNEKSRQKKQHNMMEEKGNKEQTMASTAATVSTKTPSRQNVMRRNQLPSKRASRKANTSNSSSMVSKENIKNSNSSGRDAEEKEEDDHNNTTTAINVNPDNSNNNTKTNENTTSHPSIINNNNKNSNKTNNVNNNVWQTRKNQKQQPLSQTEKSAEAQMTTSSSISTSISTKTSTLLHVSQSKAALPSKQPITTQTADRTSGTTATTTTATTTSQPPAQGHKSAYHPPHQREDGKVIAVKPPDEYDVPSKKERNIKSGDNESESNNTRVNINKDSNTEEKEERDKTLERNQRDPPKNNNYNNRRPPQATENTRGLAAIFQHMQDAHKPIKNGLMDKNKTNTTSSSQSTAAISASSKKYSMPKAPLIHAEKLQGSIEHKDEKIKKIKQQMKKKAKSQNKIDTNSSHVREFQPVLTGAEEVLRVTLEGDDEITRENAELVKRELNTILDPLGPEFVPEEPVAENQMFENDQLHYATEQAYENAPWSFQQSFDQYAQDSNTEYGSNPYFSFDRTQTNSEFTGGASNMSVGASMLSTNGITAKEPLDNITTSQANDVYSAQSTAIVAPQSLVTPALGGLGNIFINAINPSQVAQKNPQALSGNEFNTSMVGMSVPTALGYPQWLNQGAIASTPQMYAPMEDPQILLWKQQQRNINPGTAGQGTTPQSPLQNQSSYVGYYNPMPFPPVAPSAPVETGYFPRRRGRGGGNYQGRSFRGGYRRPWKDRFEDSNNPDQNTKMLGRNQTDRREYQKKRYGAQKRGQENYRSKKRDFGHNGNDGHKSDAKSEDPNSNQWENSLTHSGTGDNETYEYTSGQEIEKSKAHQTKEDISSGFETLTLSGWFFVTGPHNAQHLDNFQDRLFQMSPTRLQTFRLEFPFAVPPMWIEKVKWAQLSQFLSQANLECVVITTQSRNDLDDKDFQELEQVAKFVSQLKCKCLVLERSPCRVTPEFLQSLSPEIKELKLLCPSIEWNVALAKALNPTLNFLTIVCPSTITIYEFLEALNNKINRLYLCNDETSSRKLSPEDVSELFKHVLNLELDSSLLTEIRPMTEPTAAKTESLIIHLKEDEMLPKDYYQKYSFPKSITTFNIQSASTNRMNKGRNNKNTSTYSHSRKFGKRQQRNYNNYHNYNNHETSGSGDTIPNEENKMDISHAFSGQMGSRGFKLEYGSQSQTMNNVAMVGDNTMVSNATSISTTTSSQQKQSANVNTSTEASSTSSSSNTTKKMTFKEKLQNGPKNTKKPTTLRIGGPQ